MASEQTANSLGKHKCFVRAPFVMMVVATTLTAIIAPSGHVMPPGNVWGRSESIALIIILVASFIAGAWRLRWYETLIAGLVAGTFFEVWLPDWRDLVSAARNGPPADWWYERDFVLFILALGIACAVAAEIGRTTGRMVLRWFPREKGRCAQCDYNLRGLRKPRCPECGTPFDPERARAV